MNQSTDSKRALIFLGFAFGIAWMFALVLYGVGPERAGQVQLLPGLPGLTLALVLLTCGYMWAPAMAHLLTRWLTREGWHDLRLWPKIEAGWPYGLAAWIGPAILTVLGMIVFFVLQPQYFDPQLRFQSELVARAGQGTVTNPWRIAALQLGQAVLLAPFLNGWATFGEEFGWRAYLQPKLLALGPRRAILLMGLIWGVWHWPLTAMGHNYGLDYPGYPWLGMLTMVWFTFTCGACLGWVSLRGGSVWPAVIGHAAINAIAGLGVLFVQGQPSSLLGPLPTGLIANLPWAALTLALFLWPGAWRQPATEVPPAAPPAPPTPVAPAPETDEEVARRIRESRYS